MSLPGSICEILLTNFRMLFVEGRRPKVEVGSSGILGERRTVAVQQIWKRCNSFQFCLSRDQQAAYFTAGSSVRLPPPPPRLSIIISYTYRIIDFLFYIMLTLYRHHLKLFQGRRSLLEALLLPHVGRRNDQQKLHPPEPPRPPVGNALRISSAPVLFLCEENTRKRRR